MRDRLAWPIPVSERISIVYVERQKLERDGHALVACAEDRRTVIPVGKTAAIFLGPGTSVSHAAVALCALEGATLIWVGEEGVRLYASGNPMSSPERLLFQAQHHLDPTLRLRAARKIHWLMFGEYPPATRSVEQIRGMEGARVKALFKNLADQYGVPWDLRQTSGRLDPINSALSSATASLYGLTEAVIFAMGFSPSIGFIHSGAARSFVYDLADTVKFQTVVPLAFKIASAYNEKIESRVRAACRDMFGSRRLTEILVLNLEAIFDADDRD